MLDINNRMLAIIYLVPKWSNQKQKCLLLLIRINVLLKSFSFCDKLYKILLGCKVNDWYMVGKISEKYSPIIIFIGNSKTKLLLKELMVKLKI